MVHGRIHGVLTRHGSVRSFTCVYQVLGAAGGVGVYIIVTTLVLLQDVLTSIILIISYSSWSMGHDYHVRLAWLLVKHFLGVRVFPSRWIRDLELFTLVKLVRTVWLVGDEVFISFINLLV